MRTRGIGMDVALRRSGAGSGRGAIGLRHRPAGSFVARQIVGEGDGGDDRPEHHLRFAIGARTHRVTAMLSSCSRMRRSTSSSGGNYGVVGFLVRYLGDYLRGRALGLPHHVAYRAIRFEREAVERSERR